MLKSTVTFSTLLIIFILNIQAQNTEVSGDISGNWSADTVKVVGDITLPTGESLSIEPGVIIEYQGPVRFNVHGSISALGSETHPIEFTVADTTHMSNPNTPRGGWKGFFINNLPETDSLRFSSCKFMYGKAWEEEEDATGGLFNIFNSSNISFINCEFGYSTAEYMGGAMYMYGSDIEFKNCRFHHNRAGIDSVGYGGAVVSVGGNMKWNKCLVEDNTANGLGGAMCIWFPGQSLITNSVFQNNVGSTGGAIFFLNSNNTVFHNNLLVNNNGYFFGGALGLKNTSFPIINCTISDNIGGQGGSIYCSSGVSNPVYNTIISGNNAYGNGDQIYIAYLESTLSFYHCVVESGREAFGGSGGWFPGAYHGDYISNIEEHIAFASIPDFEYAIAAPNPVINSGFTDTISAYIPETDILGNTRVIGSQIDIGCFEYDPASGIIESRNTPQIYAFPNPFHHHLEIHFYESATEQNLFIYNLQGQAIKKIGLSGQKNTTWDGTDYQGNDLPSGLYFLRFSDGAFSKIIKN